MVTLCTVRMIGRRLLRCWAALMRPLATAACWAVCQVWRVAWRGGLLGPWDATVAIAPTHVTTFPHAMAHRSGSRWPPPPPTTNGLSSEDSPCVMSSEDSHAVGPSGVPHRTTPPSR